MNSKYENKIKIDEIKSLMKDRDFEAAVDIADTIDWSTIKDVNTLGMVSDLYKMMHMFEDSRDILLYAYERQHSKAVVKSLCEVSIILGDIVNAMDFFREYKRISPNSAGVYILQYKLYKAQNVSLDEQIEVLESLKEVDKDGKWLYELATLYHRVGMGTKCVEECEDIILWCVDGKYVLKAYELKAQHKPLTEKENFNYEVLRQSGGTLNIQCSLREEDIVEKKKEEFAIGQDVSPFNTQNLQAVVAEGLQAVIDSKTATMSAPEAPMTYERAVALDRAAREARALNEKQSTATNLQVTQMIGNVIGEEPVGQELFEDTATVGNGRSDTDILGGETQIMAQSILNGASASPVVPASEGAIAYQLNQNTDEIKPITVAPDLDSRLSKVTVNNNEAEIQEEISESRAEAKTPQSIMDANEEMLYKSTKSNSRAGIDISNTGVIETFHKGYNLDGMLTQGTDGQISMVIPDAPMVEKQITGQLSIDDVMKEWEKKKKESEERLVADVKSRVKGQAASLLADFEEGTKADLLEQIESTMVSAALKQERDRIAASRPKEIKVSDIDNKEAEVKSVEERKAALLRAEQEAKQKAAELQARREELLRQEEERAAKEAAEKRAQKEKEIKEAVEKISNGEELIREPEEAPFEEIEEVEETAEIDDYSKEEYDDEYESDYDADDEYEEDEDYDSEYEDEYEEEEDDAEAIPIKDNRDVTATIPKNKASDESVKHYSRAVERNELTASEKERFSAYIHHRKTQKQLINALENVSLASYTGNILVAAEEESEITNFSKLLIQEIQQSDSNFTGKVAMVSGSNLNKKDIASVLNKVNNGAIIISDSQQLKKSTIEKLLSELNRDNIGVIVIMQGNPDVLDTIVFQNEGMEEVFNLRIDLQAFDNKTLVEYARNYAYDNEYFIDELGELALHTRISDLQTADHDVTLSEIEELIDEAIYYADKKTPAHFFDVLFGKRYDKEDMIVLREKDFMHY